MSHKNKRKQRRIRYGRVIGAFSIVLLLTLSIGLLLARFIIDGDEEPSSPAYVVSDSTFSPDDSKEEGMDKAEPTPKPVEPHIVSSASIGVTGDILMHGPVLNAALKGSGEYDFNNNYEYIKAYYEKYDFMVANLEVTLGGKDAGNYRGYPTFNSPDTVIDALKNAGVDMLLTANNHTYDTGYNGMLRTQSVIKEKGLLHLGTREDNLTSPYIVQDINGVKVGMVCYTYETDKREDGRKSLNGITVSADAGPLISSFNYDELDVFYQEIESTLKAMETEGAKTNIVFIHWGNEYQLSPNDTQKAIAQKLCELGVDVIVGGHPHVIQPFETLTSSTGHKTHCIYSIGNAVSNQNRNTLSDIRNSKYTEDGMIFGIKYNLWNDGSVEISEISILPTWVNKESKNTGLEYNIIPLDTTVGAWNCYDVGNVSRTYESYSRTMSLVGEGLNATRLALGLDKVALEHTGK